MRLLKMSLSMILTLSSGGSFATTFTRVSGTGPVVAPAQKVADPSAKACFESACGSSYVFGQDDAASKIRAQASLALVQQELKRPMQLFMGRLIHHAVLTHSIYQNLAANPVATYEGPAKGYILAMSYLQNIGTYMPTATLDGKSAAYIFDVAKLKALPEKLNDAEIAAIQSLGGLLSLLILQMPKIDGLSYLQVLKFFYPGKTLTQAQQIEAQASQETLDQLSSMMPGYKAFSKTNIVLLRAVQGLRLSESEMNYMKAQMESRWVFNSILQPEILQAFQKIPWSFSDRARSQFKLYQASKVGQAVETPKSIRKILQASVKDGMAYLAYSHASLPSQGQIDDFRSLLKQVELVARQMMEEKTHSSLPGKFDFEINVPPARDSVVNDWKSYLSQSRVESEQRIAFLKTLDLANPDIQASALAMMIMDSGSDIFNSLSTFAHQAAPPFLRDAMLLVDNSIHLTWPTIVHPEVGAGIIAHEIGHVIEKMWPQSILKEKNCLTAKQNGTQFLSEDFADLFSSELVRRTGGKMQNLKLKNLGCGLVAPDEKLDLISLKNPDKTDIHSSALYRMLAVSSVLGETTKECSMYLSKVKETRFDSYCRWQP